LAVLDKLLDGMRAALPDPPLRRARVWACRGGCVRFFGRSEVVPLGVSVKQSAPESYSNLYPHAVYLYAGKYEQRVCTLIYRVSVLRSEAPK
jgi:hypothetical protein